MKLAKNDELVGAGLIRSRGELVLVTKNGLGKRTDLKQFPKQGRHGQGVIAMPSSKDAGLIAAGGVVNLGNRVMMISQKKNSKTVYARAIPRLARTHKGKAVMSIRGKDKIAGVIVLVT